MYYSLEVTCTTLEETCNQHKHISGTNHPAFNYSLTVLNKTYRKIWLLLWKITTTIIIGSKSHEQVKVFFLKVSRAKSAHIVDETDFIDIIYFPLSRQFDWSVTLWSFNKSNFVRWSFQIFKHKPNPSSICLTQATFQL